MATPRSSGSPPLTLARLRETAAPAATVWLLGACMEARGKQGLWLRQRPEVLEALRAQAMIQSVESSNRIEGVTVAPGRLRPLVVGGERPRDRSEEEVSGYRRALDWIFTRKRAVTLESKVLLRLHALAQGGTVGDAGRWKERDNEVVEILPDGGHRVRFLPVAASETPTAIAKLCETFEDLAQDEGTAPLLAIATAVFDFLCVHPFRDGNGRVSRLLTTFLLVRHGFAVPRYVSLERLVEESKEDYYRALYDCSRGWHEGSNEVAPFWNHFLSVLRRAYRQLEGQVEMASARPAKSALVRAAVLDQVGPFTLADLVGVLPGLSAQLVKRVLADMKAHGLVNLEGRGRGAVWRAARRRSP